MKTLLRLQQLDLKIEAYEMREAEIPKQRDKFDIQRKRLAAELQERENTCRQLALEQRSCELEIEQKQAQIAKYDQQLFSIKKNEEYQALLHEIEVLRKQVGTQEERVLVIMMEMDDAKARLAEDKKRIQAELEDIDRQCREIAKELAEAIRAREQLEKERIPIAKQVNGNLLERYKRIRESKKSGPAVVPLTRTSCSGCHMAVTPQIVNEILAGNKVHSCAYCGRLLYNDEKTQEANAEAS